MLGKVAITDFYRGLCSVDFDLVRSASYFVDGSHMKDKLPAVKLLDTFISRSVMLIQTVARTPDHAPRVENINFLLFCNFLNRLDFFVIDRLSRIIVADMTVIRFSDLQSCLRFRRVYMLFKLLF